MQDDDYIPFEKFREPRSPREVSRQEVERVRVVVDQMKRRPGPIWGGWWCWEPPAGTEVADE